MEERVFATHGETRPVTKIQLDQPGGPAWCDVIGMDEEGVLVPAKAERVDDSADGTAWLITGGTWGLRFRLPGSSDQWDVNNPQQWGKPFMVLDSSGKDFQ